MICISHIKSGPDGWMIQTNENHSEGVAKLAGQFASTFGMEDFGRVMGWLHDKGKERMGFQQYIRRVSGFDPDMIVEGPSDHAFIGAVVSKMLFPKEHGLFSNAIMGHHRGLYDDDEWKEKLREEIPQDVTVPTLSEGLRIRDKIGEIIPRDLHHLERVLFSCLVDADYLDTESFMNPDQSRLRGHGDSMTVLLERLESYLLKLKEGATRSSVNDIRDQVQEWCRQSGGDLPGYYSLTVPTGGGKTLSSMLWALKHAVAHRKQRIIIAIPFTSIITQTAEVLRSVFGERNVLEHHSDVVYSDSMSDINRSLQLASQNWDYPVIVTTNVQFFESIFSNKPSSCRKIHNIVNSVVILDEAQTLPCEFLRPIVEALETYHRVFHCTFLFTTASQPTLSGEITGTNPSSRFTALPSIHEIIPPTAKLHEKLRRVKLSFDETASTYNEIAERIADNERVLCIVNTRTDAKVLYEMLPKEGLRIHLSRMMCPAHLRKSIHELKDALHSGGNSPIRVISTQLIEAGVDIDFPVVFRQEAGLDSILQAAGRCNREGKQAICPTYVFSLTKEHPLPSGYLSQTNNARINMGKDHDWFSQEAMSSYFKQLYSRVNSFDKHDICNLLDQPSCIYFESASEVFRLIDENGVSVVVNWERGMELVQKWKICGPSAALHRALAQYSVNVRQRDFEKLQCLGVIQQLDERLFFIEDPSFYGMDVGLVVEDRWAEEVLIA